MLHVNSMNARNPERYMVISKQRAENSNKDLKSTPSVDWIDNQKVCITFWKAKYYINPVIASVSNLIVFWIFSF